MKLATRIREIVQQFEDGAINYGEMINAVVYACMHAPEDTERAEI